MPRRAKRPIDAWVIAFNETHNYALEEPDASSISRILGVYLFDINERTCCCELTPSHYLIHLYDVVEFVSGYLPDSEVEGLRDKYEGCGGEPIYVHCHEVEQHMERHSELCHHHGKTGTSYKDTPYDEQMEALEEYLCSNHVI